MKNKLALPTRLILGTLLMAGFIAPLHAVPQTQDTSTASLADTLAWLVSFVPTQTGASFGDGAITSTISNISGCNMTVTSSASFGYTTYVFSLSDINPASIQVEKRDPTNTFYLHMNTRASALLVKETQAPNDGQPPTTFQNSGVMIDLFADQTAAQRVVNAFQHAANLCANASPF
jgi:hypothetical protein